MIFCWSGVRPPRDPIVHVSHPTRLCTGPFFCRSHQSRPPSSTSSSPLPSSSTPSSSRPPSSSTRYVEAEIMVISTGYVSPRVRAGNAWQSSWISPQAMSRLCVSSCNLFTKTFDLDVRNCPHYQQWWHSGHDHDHNHQNYHHSHQWCHIDDAGQQTETVQTSGRPLLKNSRGDIIIILIQMILLSQVL